MIFGATDKDLEGSWKWQYSSDAPILFGTGEGAAFELTVPGEGDPDPWYENWGGSYPDNRGEHTDGNYGIFYNAGWWRDYRAGYTSKAVLEVEEDQINVFTMPLSILGEGD